MREVATDRVCVGCGTPIKPGQSWYTVNPPITSPTQPGPHHVACPTKREVEHAARMGRTEPAPEGLTR